VRKSTAKTQRKNKNKFLVFYYQNLLLSISSLRLGVLAVNLSLALLCVLASWRLIFLLLFFAPWRLGG